MTTVRASRLGLGSLLLLALLAVSAGVAIYVYHARTPDLALEVKLLDRKFAPAADGEGEQSPIRFFVRYTDPHASVEIVGRDKTVIRTIDDDVALSKGKKVTYRWDGLDDEGELAEPGRYRLRVILPSVDRDMVFPRRITLEPEPFSPPSRNPDRSDEDAGSGG